MEHSPSWEANRSSASQEIPPHFMETKRSLPHSQEPATCSYPEPDQCSPTPSRHFFKIHFNITLPSSLRSSKCLFPSGFPTKILHSPLPIRATFPAHLIDLSTWIIFGEKYCFHYRVIIFWLCQGRTWYCYWYYIWYQFV